MVLLGASDKYNYEAPEGGGWGGGACLGASLGPRGRGLSEAPGGASLRPPGGPPTL